MLDASPTRRARDAPAYLALPLERRLLAAHEWLGADELGPRAGLGPVEAEALGADLVRSGAAVRVGGWIVDRDALAHLRLAAAEEVRAHHARAPLEPGVDLASLASELRVDAGRLRAAVEHDGDLVVERGYVREAGRPAGVAGSAEARALLDALEAAPFSPPEPASVGADPALVRSMVREGTVVDLEGIVFAAGALDEARRRIRNALRDRGTVTVADVRDLLGSTRKYVLPILKQLDADGVTRRRGDDRIPGPAALRDA